MGTYYEVPAGDSADNYHQAVERAGVIELPDTAPGRHSPAVEPAGDRSPDPEPPVVTR